MIRSATAMLLAVLSSASTSLAQDTTVFFEDFENGIPPGWYVFVNPPLSWRHVQNGDCGAVTSMLAYNRLNQCDYAPGAVGLAGGDVYLPQLNWSVPGIAVISFDYILDSDAAFDQVQVRINNSVAPGYTLAAGRNFVNDGALHSIVIDSVFGHASAWDLNTFSIAFLHDGVGDLGRGLMIDNVRVSVPPTNATYCTVSAASPCPCAGSGPLFVGGGCPNSTGTGTTLRGVGNPSLAADTYRLGAEWLPTGAPSLFFEGTAQTDLPFGDGRLCTGGTITRLGMKFATGGYAILPEAGEVPISQRSLQTAGTTRFYQVFYRDPAGPCGSGMNITHGTSITWGP